MAKDFTAKAAKNLIKRHGELLTDLTEAEMLKEILRSNIKKAADAAVESEILTVLRNVPVEELNRVKSGFRIKSLIDNNFTTVADLYKSSVYSIAAVKGISDDGAFTIKGIVDDFVDKTRSEVKIRLSRDRRDEYSTALVKAVSIYKNGLQFVQKCAEILIENRENISDYLYDLRPATNSLRWIFTSKKTKAVAIQAYNALSEMLSGKYNSDAKFNISSLHRVLKTSDDEAWKDFAVNNVRFFNILEEIVPGLLGTDDTLYGLPEDLARDIQGEGFFPDGLKCTLRRYQEWGVKYILHQKKVLLGDEMGLGKTIQAIAAMVSLKNTGATHFAVVCPASVVTNWCREITKHSLLTPIKVHGADRKNALNSWLKAGGVAVTTYETTNFFQLEDDFKIAMLVVDEAHYIKNPEAKRTKNAKKLCKHAESLLFMTGTALENRVDEMVSLISILQPEIARDVSGITFMAGAPQFRNRVAPVYYRRKREDVLTELPELIESKEWCEMTEEEECIYEDAILGKHFTEARRVSWNIENLKFSSKASRLKEIVEEAEAEERKVIVFSFFLDTIRKIKLFLGRKCLNPINGSLTPQRRQEIIDEFDRAPAGSVLVVQIQSGGTGLNIQSASVVVICEPQFKPSTENQAISRAYRMGQSRNVLVYRLLCEDTVDERITELLERKQEVFDAFADKSVAAEKSLEIDETSFGNIVSDEIARITEKRNNEGAK